MNHLLATLSLLFVFCVAGFAQQGRLSPDDQREFDKYYTKWVNDTRKNDRDDIAKDVRRMQDIMARYNIPANLPYEQIASTGAAYGQRTYQGRLSPDDQREFDKQYTKWVNDTRKNDRDDIAKDERRMLEIMARNNIPPNVPFDQVASTGYGNQNYERGNYPGYATTRLSLEDQREFDKYYSRWLEDSRNNDRADVESDTRHMEDIMARYNIPANVPFDQIASPDAASRR